MQNINEFHPPIPIYLGREGIPDFSDNKMKINLKDKNPDKVKKVFLDLSNFEHFAFFGKSGSGKSYALGVLIEESVIQNSPFATIIIDPLGNFSTMEIANRTNEIENWNKELNRRDIDQNYAKKNHDIIKRKTKIMIPAESTEFFDPLMYDETFSINIRSLDENLFCYAFDMKSTDPMISLLTRAKKRLKGTKYTISDLITDIELGSGHHATKDALVRKLEILESLNLVTNDAPEIYNIVHENETLIFDLSMSSEYTNRIIVNFLAKQLMKYRHIITGKKNCSKKLIAREAIEWRKYNSWYLPPIRLIIDEAHEFIPGNKVIKKVITQGRNKGFLLGVASQSADLSKAIYENITHVFIGKMKYEEDITAVKKLTATELSSQKFKALVKSLGKGMFLYFNDDCQHILMKFKPRYSFHPASSKLENEKKYLIIGNKKKPKTSTKIEDDTICDANEMMFAGWMTKEQEEKHEQFTAFQSIINIIGKEVCKVKDIPYELREYIPIMKEKGFLRVKKDNILWSLKPVEVQEN
jgi:DNA helicase HerA-like ATPase